MRRRDFLAASLATASGFLLPCGARAGAGSIHRKAARPLRILFLGGTGFVGPAIVDLALERGHEVTLFNRGQTNPWLYTHLERLVGNRYPDRGPGLAPLRGDRRWDAVIDTWQGSPVAVDLTTKLLRDRVDAYAYISSIAVYQGLNYRKESYDESAELPAAEMPSSIDVELQYPVRKQLGEEAVARELPERHAILRAYGIKGLDAQGRIDEIGLAGTAYWPMRLRRGGEILAPGDGRDFTQWTDVRDLAEFTLQTLENGLYGAYNVSRGATFDELLAELAELSPGAAELTWVPAERLFERGIESFTDVPGWIWRHETEGGFFYAGIEKALAAGLRPRSIRETYGLLIDAFLRDYSGFEFTHREHGVEIARREKELLEAWRHHRTGTDPPPTR